MSSLAEVRLWGRRIGGVLLPDEEGTAVFEYDPEFARSGPEVAPLKMPVRPGHRYRFPELARTSFEGLPGLVSDSLPDRYGNALIDAWLASQGRDPGSFNAVERLCYVGRRGMGALEFEPLLGPDPASQDSLDLEALIDLAGEVLARRSDLAVSLQDEDKRAALEEILRVGSSAGGARAKALVALDPASGEMRSGQLELPEGFEHWILKFDGVGDDGREIGTARGYGAIEYVYSELAREAGIEIAECRLLEEGGRRHFMTRRFDRGPGGEKLHMQSLAAISHLDYTQPGAHSYEQCFQAMRKLGLPKAQIEQMFRRATFNVVARNQDDHVKNIAFLMGGEGAWRLAPAFDLTYAFNPSGEWTSRHQMSLNGKRDDFERDDFAALARNAGLVRGRHEKILDEVVGAVTAWPERAAAAGISDQRIAAVGATLRLDLD